MNAAAHAANLLGASAIRVWPLTGGDLSQIVAVALSDGRKAVVKTGPAPRTEAAMLDALARAGVPAPRVLAVDDAVLAIELLPDTGDLARAGADLGRVLKTLHAAEGPAYGWSGDYAFGTVAIPNGFLDDWPRFWAERRLLPSVPFVPSDLARRLETLAKRLTEELPAHPRPSLLHGDLWGGNVLASGGKIRGLIDPACYYGDGEVDLAMLNLFGRTDAAFAAAYGALPPGWQRRRAIYQLWPALVHLRLFGAGYRPLAEGLLDHVA